MKRKLLFLSLVLGTSLTTYAQKTAAKRDSSQRASVEKSLFNVQLGLFEMGINNEFKIARKWTLRPEIKADFGFAGHDFYTAPTASLTSRYYYNMDKRWNNGKDISHNSGNFIYGKLSFQPAVLTINRELYSNLGYFSSSAIIGYGLKRNLNQHFNYELGAGLGIKYDNITRSLQPCADITMRIGFQWAKFKK